MGVSVVRAGLGLGGTICANSPEVRLENAEKSLGTA